MEKATYPRVMIVIHSLKTGGGEMVVSHLAEALNSSNYQVMVVSLCGTNTPIATHLRSVGVAVAGIDKKPGLDFRVVKVLKDLMDRFQPTAIHTHLPVLEYVFPAARWYDKSIRIVHTFHSLAQTETRKRSIRAVNFLAFRRGVIPVALNRQVATSVCSLYGLREDLVHIVPNGIDLQPYRFETEVDVRRDSIVNCLCVARLSEVKNHLLLLDVIAEANRRSSKEIKLTLVGDGPLRNTLERHAMSLEIQDLVTFAGEQEDPVNFYRNADIFLLFSTYEGLPLSIIEAMASGLPVIASNVGGIPEMVISERNGFAEEPKSRQLADRVVQLAEDPVLRESMGRQALLLAERYSADAMMNEYLKLYG